jgi:hypothetical protein
MTDRSDKRASDDDRDRTAEILREAHSEGRLSQDELLTRIEVTYSAQTYRELDQVVADLPLDMDPMSWKVDAKTSLTRPASPPAVASPAGRPVQASGRGRRFARGLLTTGWWVYGGVVAINITIWLAVSIFTGDMRPFWPLWVAGPWGVVWGTAEAAYRSRDQR